MRFSQFNENQALADAAKVIEKNFSPERAAIKDKVVALIRDIQMGKGDKMQQAMELTALTKSELEAKRNDPDLTVGVDLNVGMMKRAMDALTNANESITEEELEEYKSTARLRNDSMFNAMAKLQDKRKPKEPQIKKIELPKQMDLFKAVGESSDIDEFDFFDKNIHSIEDLENYNWDSLSNEEIKDLLRYAEIMYRAQDYNGDEEFAGYFSAVENFLDNLLAQRQGNVSESLEALTEEQFDQLAEKKDACYRKVKSRYKVWPSAYASGALVQCRKVGAANWGNKSKKKK